MTASHSCRRVHPIESFVSAQVQEQEKKKAWTTSVRLRNRALAPSQLLELAACLCLPFRPGSLPHATNHQTLTGSRIFFIASSPLLWSRPTACHFDVCVVYVWAVAWCFRGHASRLTLSSSAKAKLRVRCLTSQSTLFHSKVFSARATASLRSTPVYGPCKYYT